MSAPIPEGTIQSTVFSGIYKNAEGELPDANLLFKPSRGIFDENHPRFIFRTKCNVALYSNSCGLLRSAGMFVGEYVEDVDGSSEIVRIHITTFGDFGTTGFTAVHEGWFDGGTFTIITGGVVSVVGIGATRVQESGSHLVLELDKAFKAVAVAGDTVKLLRTCDGRWTTCQALGGKFRGFPHIPPSSPTNAVARKSQSPAGKK